MGLEEFFGFRDALVQVLFVCFVVVDAEEDVSTADKPELWGFIVESYHLEYVAYTIPV